MSKYCSIEKAMAGKTVLENEIATLIRDYMSNTGLIVTNIETKDLLFLLFLNSTTPSVNANKVWSFPMPTLIPGLCVVPLWRTRILPAVACWPPYNLTPNRLLSDSRPLWELPIPFLCAISVCFFRF